jgi:hypothetical protein
MKPFLIFLACIAALAVLIVAVGYSACDCSSLSTVFKIGWERSWDFVHERHEEVIAVGTVFIAIFTILLGIFTVILAGATQALVRGAERTERRQLRAYLHNLKGTVRGIEVDKIPYVEVDIKNFGQTPAYNVRQVSNLALAHYPWTESGDLPEAQSVSCT